VPPPVAPHQAAHNVLGLLFLVWVVCNVLMSIWIFTDIRKRGAGSALFGVMALFAGIPAAVIYALARLGDGVAVAPPPPLAPAKSVPPDA
jgi:hypothetical protein